MASSAAWGVGATIHYYQSLIDASRLRGIDLALLIAHADVSRVLSYVGEAKLSELSHYLAGFANRLVGAGAEVGAIAAITPHICLPELRHLTKLPFISLPEETAREIKLRGLKRVALFGTRFTIETRLFGTLDEVEVILPKREEIDAIHSAYVGIVNAGRASAKDESNLRTIAHTLCRRDGVEAIVLAGTELALVFNQDNTDFPAVDCAQVHIDAIIRKMAGI
ncbi:MAG TPA: aspartate/glutamate racemase family protein [Xanthobacteraceae bacterium]|nr:aspartate/glutamate racemase family protein [Xanthobacteraceae bacterium]